MSIKIGSISSKDIYVGAIPAKEIRLGSDLIWSRVVEPEAYYTLTVNFEGNKEAFSNGYKIYVDNAPSETYRPDAEVSFEHSFSIAAGSSIWTEMSRFYPFDTYAYSQTINPTPANPWIMDKDYSVTVVAEKNGYTLTVDFDDGVDYVDIYYKQPYESEFTELHKVPQVKLMSESQYYIVPSLVEGYVLDSTYGLGAAENPETLNEDTKINIYTQNYSVDDEYELHISHESGIRITDIKVKIGGNVVYSQKDYTNGIYDAYIKHNGNESVEVHIGTSGSIESYDWSGTLRPQLHYHTFSWDSLPESGTLSVRISSS